MHDGLSPDVGVELDQLRAAFEQLATPTAILAGPEAIFAFTNESLRRLLGRDPTGVPLREVVPALALPEKLEAVRRALLTGEPALLAGVPLASATDANGSATQTVQVRVARVRDAAGTLRGMLLEVHAAAIEAGPGAAGNEARLAQLETILGSVQDGITVQDASGRLLYANDAAARFVGLPDARTFVEAPVDTVLARFELMDGQGRPLERDALPGRRAFRGEQDPERLVCYRDRATGEQRWSMVRAHGIRDGTGRVVMVVNAFHDLTELMSHEQKLVESEARFHAMADTAPVLIWQSDVDGQLDWFNLPWLAFTGRTIEQESGDGWIDGVHPDDRDATRATYREAFDARRPFRTEFRLRRSDGAFRWILDHGVPRFSPDGTFVGYIGSCVDVHDRVAQTKTLEETKARLEETAAELEQTIEHLQEQKAEAQRAAEQIATSRGRNAFLADAGRLLATSLDPTVTLRSLARLAVPRIADWCTVHVFEAERARRIEIAHSDPEMLAVAREIEESYPPILDERSALGRVLRSGESELYEDIPDHLLASVARDDRHLELLRTLGLRSGMVVPLRVHEHILGVLTLLATRDSGRNYGREDLELAEEVARRAAFAIRNARLYEEAEAANRAKANFLAVMSHELRTPLTAIVGNADLLDLEVWGPINGRQRERVGRIKASARHLMTIIDEILTFTRLEATSEEIHVEEFDPAALLAETLEIIEAEAADKGLRVAAYCDRAPPRWTSDAAKLRQILINLLGNAVKFTDEGGVEIDIRHADRELVVRVTDTGPGIPPDQIEHIFEAFTQVDQSRTRLKGGTGLGLPVSRRLARLLGGDITVATTPGEGSTFTLTLPAAGG